MLELRPGCECCDADLPPQSKDAMICSFECTFCRDCAANTLNGQCPNCGGELLQRPRRPAEKLIDNPASTKRVFKPRVNAGSDAKAVSSLSSGMAPTMGRSRKVFKR